MRSRPSDLVLLAMLCMVAGGTGAAAQTEPATGDAAVTWRESFKATGVFSRYPEDAALFPDRGSATGLWRFRLEPTARVGDNATLEFAVEQRVRAFSSESGTLGASVLPSEADAPFRLRQLDWRLAASANSEWRAEVDRAALHVRAGAAEVTIGRQAVGWGRGVLFGAVDLFAPFTPLEADREWRRGVDAVRADVKLADRVSVDAVGAFGSDLDHSVVAARLRGYAGKMDLEVVGGRRARDLFGGITTSAAVGEAEVHGELAVFRAPAVPGSSIYTEDRSIAKAVAGGSYRIPLGHGVLVYGEYHYSGFGATSSSSMMAQLADPAFQERYLRGDTQILGRHAMAALASYELSPEVSFAAQWLQNPVDGSGVLVPSCTLTFGDHASLGLSGYASYGMAPSAGVLRSEFGTAPRVAFAQLRIYR